MAGLLYSVIVSGLIPANMDDHLSAKQKNCVLRNSLIQKQAKDVDKGLASERNVFEKRMNVEAKKLLKKLAKTSDGRQDALERHGSPRLPSLPVIHHPDEDPARSGDEAAFPRSPPGSPNNLKRSGSLQPLSNEGARGHSLLHPPENPLPGIRRGSCSDIEKAKQLGGAALPRRGSIGTVGSRSEQAASPAVSPTMPRNLALRERARRESSLRDLEVRQGQSEGKGPNLHEQFQALGSCRYLRKNSEDE